MKEFGAYWIVGCVLVGLAAGSRENRCPQDKYPEIHELAASAAVWPAFIAWALVKSRKPACDVPPSTTAQ